MTTASETVSERLDALSQKYPSLLSRVGVDVEGEERMEGLRLASPQLGQGGWAGIAMVSLDANTEPLPWDLAEELAGKAAASDPRLKSLLSSARVYIFPRSSKPLDGCHDIQRRSYRKTAEALQKSLPDLSLLLLFTNGGLRIQHFASAEDFSHLGEAESESLAMGFASAHRLISAGGSDFCSEKKGERAAMSRVRLPWGPVAEASALPPFGLIIQLACCYESSHPGAHNLLRENLEPFFSLAQVASRGLGGQLLGISPPVELRVRQANQSSPIKYHRHVAHEAGAYFIPLPPGPYHLAVKKPGYSPMEADFSIPISGPSPRLDIRLKSSWMSLNTWSLLAIAVVLLLCVFCICRRSRRRRSQETRRPRGQGWELLKAELSSSDSEGEVEDLQNLMLNRSSKHFADLSPTPKGREPWTNGKKVSGNFSESEDEIFSKPRV